MVATKISDSIKSIEGVKFIEREFVNSDLEGCSFCIAATDDKKFNAYVAGVCRKYHILINVVDDKDNCQFLFPSVYKAGNLSIGISTQGASPYIAADIKNRIASELPPDIEQILDYLCSIRENIKAKVEESSKRAAIFKASARRCMVLGRKLDDDELDEIIASVKENEDDETKKGRVVIAGAGCGAYDLITVRALNAVKAAEVIVYDDLIDEHLLEFAPESCELIYAGKRSGRHSKAQEEINELLVEKAIEGRYVVRLKGGDPYVFGRGGEEALALKEHGIPVHEVPGVTSSIGLCGMAGIPVTHRGASRGFHVITGHTADNLPPEIEEIRWKSYAKLDETFVFLMGLKSIDMITEKLMRYGKLSDTPVAVIHGENTDGTYVKFVGTLSDIAAKVKEVDFPSPAIIVVGEVASLELTD